MRSQESATPQYRRQWNTQSCRRNVSQFLVLWSSRTTSSTYIGRHFIKFVADPNFSTVRIPLSITKAVPESDIKELNHKILATSKGIKRPTVDNQTATKKPRISPEKRSPVAALHKLDPDLKFQFSESGPPHRKVFTASLIRNGQTHSATGSSKRTAKASVAERVLQCCHTFAKVANKFQEDVGHNVETGNPCPVHILHQRRPGLKYDVIKEEGKPHEKMFTVQVAINGRTFQGTVSSKKRARNAAAYEALRGDFIPSVIPPASVANAAEESTEFADYVSGVIESAYQDVTKDHQDQARRYKVLAGIVMTRGTGDQGAVVICVTSGSKCIRGGRLSLEGEAVNDCHAEILARRCLLGYLYNQLQSYKSRSSSSIFTTGNSGRLRLKDGVRFHLYISSTPCGDARIFAFNDTAPTIGSGRDPHLCRRRLGVLRTKIEAGEGTLPVVATIQTWDGIAQGGRLRTMSCSDKLARWNVVGLQGSVLSHLIEPVYLSTLVIGSLFHRHHLERAVVGRIEHVQGLPVPFRLMRPFLQTTSTPPARKPDKSAPCSVYWTVGWSEAEIVDSSSGRPLDGSVSRLSKRRLFECFIRLVSSDSAWRIRIDDCIRHDSVSYRNVKAAAKDFSEAKEKLQMALTTAQLGRWITKPPEQNCFELHVPPAADADGSNLGKLD